MAARFVAPEISFGDRISKEEEFFSRGFLMSYSGLNRLLFSPALFYNHYVLGQREDVNDRNMIEGKLIHCLLLKPEDFDKDFVLSAFDLPSDNPRQLLHTLFNHYKEIKRLPELEDTREELHEFAPDIIDILADMNLYQTLKTDSQRLEKIITEKSVAYWDYLKKSVGRTVIDQEVYDFAKSVVAKITSTPAVISVMGYFDDPSSGVIKHNEIELVNLESGYEFGLRGFVDNLVIDPVKKEIRVNDVKKTSKDISSFTDSIEYYKYYLQAAMYYRLVQHVYLSRPEYADFKITFRFIVIDPYMQIAPIRVSDEKMSEWINVLDKQLMKAHHHFAARDFSLPYDFLVNNEMVL